MVLAEGEVLSQLAPLNGAAELTAQRVFPACKVWELFYSVAYSTLWHA